MATKEKFFVDNKNGTCRLCTEPDEADGHMVQCDDCDRWFHLKCVKLTKPPTASQVFLCVKCSLRPSVSSQSPFTSKEKEQGTFNGDETLLIKELTKVLKNFGGPRPNEKNVETMLRRESLIILPTFDGKPKDWPRFKKTLLETTKEGKFTQLENLHQIQRALRGEAEKSVRPLMLDPLNVPAIIDRLEESFGRPEVVYREMVKDVLKVRIENPYKIPELADAMDNLVMNVTALSCTNYLNDPRLIDDVMARLPLSYQLEWIDYTSGLRAGEHTLSELNDWLKSLARKIRRVVKTTGRDHLLLHEDEFKHRRSETNHRPTQPTNEKKGFNCPECGDNHSVVQCEAFKAKTIGDKWVTVKAAKLCHGCLRFSNHQIKDCKFWKGCGVNGCTNKHHPLMHNTETGLHPVKHHVQHHDMTTEKRKVYYQITPVTLRNGSSTVKTYAFLDPGSSLTLLEEGVASLLELEGVSDPLRMKWTGDIKACDMTSRRVKLNIMGANNLEHLINEVRTVQNLNLPVQSINIEAMKNDYPHLKNVPVNSYTNVRPTILIGLKHSHLIVPLNKKEGLLNQPIAIETKLGWIIFGNEETNNNDTERLFIMREDECMDEMLKQYFSTEDFGVKLTAKPVCSDEDERALNTIAETLKHEDGRYEIGLLWKSDNINFPDSYANALGRLKSLERQLKKQPELKEWAIQTFKEYEGKGYLRKLTPSELLKPNQRLFYLPHFIVINRNKPEPKPRIVFDAASKVEGVSLNSQLLPGPDALTSLFGILLRFREGKIAVAGDIKEMFHQVKVRPEDQQAQCVLWRGCNEEKPPDIYTMQVMTFGATCSPACAQAVKNENALRCKQSYPKAYKAILNQHYVDDYIDSFSTENEAKETTEQVITVHDHASFHIRNFISNSESLLRAIPAERRQCGESVVTFEEKHAAYDKILGVYWNVVSDCIGYNIKHENIRTDIMSIQNPTKREVLSFVMSIYDPLGLISYLTIQGRILLRSIHQALTDWDERIPEDLGTKWREWLRVMKEANLFEVPRCVIPANTQSIELHTFVDASEEAFAACVYLRCYNGQRYTTHLLAAKARVAPLKLLSIPRLELQAAVLGVRLTNQVKGELRVAIQKTVYWSDSQTVLGWIVNRKRKYHQFVAHRVSEILETSAMDQWRWVPTKENPADQATKITVTNDAWKHGPLFLLEEECMWPQARIKPTTEEERVTHHSEGCKLLDEDNYSDWRKLVRHGVILRKFVSYLKDKKEFSPITRMSDVEAVKAMMYIRAQRECFPAEYLSLENEKPVSKQSSLNKLLPFLDDQGIMRSRSRLENLEAMPPGARNPIIIPQKHRITKLLVRDYHEQSLHQADNVVIGNLRQEFWIINVRAVLNNVKRCCQWCILHACKPAQPLMAPLPEFRANPYKSPFLHTGVDYFGPFEVAVRRSTEKRWGVIFICMSTRAVHLELAKKLDTDSFLICLKNFQHRRGKIGHLYSDNGTNFVGADKELSHLVANINDRMGKEAATQYNIEWHFNPPSAPHFGGIWERQIQTIKKGLRQMMDEWRLRKPSPETLVATLIEIEFILNSRPLTHIPVTNDEEEILTPFHFLIGRSGSAVPPLSLTTSSIDTKQYKQVQHHSKVFWDRWKREYLPTLLKRDKWTNKVEPLQEDDLVVLTDDNATPGKWLKGRIVKVHRAADDQVRSVEVRTVNGVLKRPVVKVALVNVKQKEHILNVNGKRRNEKDGCNEDAKQKRIQK